ncbi:hypothetical protein ABNP34_16260 (plasmid) [Glutamicibacter mishrai]|uniref:hypothetical protein n=1 Tax=Glutamicibacter mishrai TaxID=1775880 RepID=UPI0032EFD3BC
MSAKPSEYLSGLKRYAQEIIGSLPEGFCASAEQREHDVLLKLKGPNLGQFVLVLGGEVAEVNYDDRFYGYETLSDEHEELREFIREIVDDIVLIIQNGMPLVERKRLMAAPKLVLPRRNGVNLLLRKRRSIHR